MTATDREKFIVNRRLGMLARRGFSFVEILFAVMILGIGFILIAGVFPVAINQTQANGDETIAATLARQAVTTLANLPNTATNMATDGNIHRFGESATDPLWKELNGCQILSEDPRYAWVPFYCRRTDPPPVAGAATQPSNWAQVTVIGVRVRNHDTYTSVDAGFSPGTLIGKQVVVNLTAGASLSNADVITFLSGATGAVAPGTYVVIATDPSANASGSAVGWVLKVGNSTGSPGAYFLQPGGDMKNSPLYKPTSPLTTAFIVGQGLDPDNPNATPPAFTGGAQDIMAYTTYLPVH